MAWIESHQGIKDHPKTWQLAEVMGWDIYSTVGRLHSFWWWCLEYAPTGDLRRFNDTILAQSVGLNASEAKKFVDAMVASCWIDRGKNVFRVHDWVEYAGRYLRDSKFKNSPDKWEKTQELYSSSVVKKSADNQPKVSRQLADNPPYLNQPTYTNHNQPKEDTTKGEDKPSGFADFCKSALTTWNSFCDKKPILSKIQEITPERRTRLKRRYEQATFREFDKILAALETQPFCFGENDRKWRVSFDWIILNDTNYVKILEKKYGGGVEDIPDHLKPFYKKKV